MSKSKLCLKSVVLGCRDDTVYDLLTSSLGLPCGRKSEECCSSSRSPKLHSTVFVQHYAQSHRFEGSFCLQYGHNLSRESAAMFGLQDTDESVLRNIVVISTSPFSIGKVDHSTEIIIVKIPPELKTGPPHRRRITPPTVSHFLTQYEHDSDPKSIHLRVAQLEESLEQKIAKLEPLADLDTALVIHTDLAYELGSLSTSLVWCKIHDGVKRRSRYMQIVVSTEVKSKNEVLMTSVAWYNLGGKLFVDMEDRRVSVKRVCPTSPVAKKPSMGIPLSSSSNSLAEYEEKLLQATKFTVAAVYQLSECPADVSNSDSVKEYFSRDRYICIGDVFIITVNKKEEKQYKRLMKVTKINNLDKSTATFRANSSSTLYEDMSVNGYILPEICSDFVPISNAFSKQRNILLNILKPFIIHKWSPSPTPLVLISGPEGSGKSYVVNQLAQLLQCNYMEMNCIHLVADTIMSTENRIKELLAQVVMYRPAVLLLRNIHTLTKDEINNLENPRISQTFQQSLEQTLVESNWPIIVVGTCEHMNTVSEGIREMALHEINFEAPDVDERFLILEEMTSELNLHPTLSLNYLAEHTAGCLQGDLRALVGHANRNSVIRAMKICEQELSYICEETIAEGKVFVTTEDFDLALLTVQSQHSKDLGAPKIPNVKWTDIGGLEDVKQDILDTIQLPLVHPEFFISTMRRSGVLLYGPPGTGKTLLAKAVATECSLNFFSVKGPELINMYVGQSEENVRQVFSKARAASPCVIFFDELDSLAPNRGRSGDSGGVMDRVVSQLLSELDGMQKTTDVFVIGATNRPDLLDPALLRPGRFDKLVYVGISSDPSQQLTILKAITRMFDLEPDCDLTQISQNLPSYLTGADLYSLCSEAMTNAIKRQIDLIENEGKRIEDCKLTVNMKDFLLAVEQLTPSLSMEEIARYEQVRSQFNQLGSQPPVVSQTSVDQEILPEEGDLESENANEFLSHSDTSAIEESSESPKSSSKKENKSSKSKLFKGKKTKSKK